ncbi:hypothetical protein [Corallococcus sp. M7]
MRDLSSHRKALGFLYVFVHALLMLGAGTLAFTACMMALMADSGSSARTVPMWQDPFVLAMAGVAMLLGMLALAGLFLGSALLQGRPVSKRRATLLAIFALPNFPLGTVLGIYSLWFFGQEGWDEILLAH